LLIGHTMSTADQALQQAIEHHRANRLEDAERLYRAILQAQPKHPDANHNLGVLAVSAGQAQAALPFLRTALEANQQVVQFWLSFASALLDCQQNDAARQVLTAARQRRLTGEAIDKLEQRLAPQQIQPAAEPPLAPAIAMREAGRYVEAAAWLTNWIDTQGKAATDVAQIAEAHALTAHVLLLDKQEAAAAEALGRAVALAPAHPAVARNRARLALKQNQADAALAAAQAAQQTNPDNPESWLVLAAALEAKQRNAEALPLVERALQVCPNYAEAWANRALIRLRGKDQAGALADVEHALQLKPHLPQLWSLAATLRFQRSDLAGAIAAQQTALGLEPENIIVICKTPHRIPTTI